LSLYQGFRLLGSVWEFGGEGRVSGGGQGEFREEGRGGKERDKYFTLFERVFLENETEMLMIDILLSLRIL
jgi:hypothetical protein